MHIADYSYKRVVCNIAGSVIGNIYLNKAEKLEYKDKHNHILAVSAQDCAERKSKPVMVNFKITPACVLGWQGEYSEPFGILEGVFCNKGGSGPPLGKVLTFQRGSGL